MVVARSAAGPANGGRPQETWAATGGVAGRDPPSALGAVVAAAAAEFAACRTRAEQDARAAGDRLVHLEQMVVAAHDRRAEAYNTLLGLYRGAENRLAVMSADLQATHAETVSLRRQVVRLGEERDLLTKERDQLRQEADQAKAEKDGRKAAHRREAEEREAALQRGLEERDAAHRKELEEREAARRKELEEKDAVMAVAAREEEAARLEYERRLQEWSARAAKDQEVAIEGDRLLAVAFPGTQEAAVAAVEAHRKAQRAAGAQVGEHAPWTVQEVAVGGRVRLDEGVRALKRLQATCLGMVRSLWPNAVAPDSMSRLDRWLEAGPARVDAWRSSAARAGAAMALRVARSWYPGLDFGLLAA